MPGYYELKPSTDGQFNFTLKAGNHEIILTSQRYKTRKSAESGIASCQKNSQNPKSFERKVAKDGRNYFTLKASNGQVIGTSGMYRASPSMEKGIKSVMNNGTGPVKVKE